MTTPPWCREKVIVYYYYLQVEGGGSDEEDAVDGEAPAGAAHRPNTVNNDWGTGHILGSSTITR